MATETDELADAPIYSASKLSSISKCGRLYKYKYVDKIPEPVENSAQKFGNVIHNAVERWYGPDDEPVDHTKVSLVDLVKRQWVHEIPPLVWEHVKILRDLDEECQNTIAAIAFKRPTLKNPAQTKEYQESAAAKAFQSARVEMLNFCSELTDVRWPKDEDAYKSYVKSLVIAKQMEDMWKGRPRPLLVEGSFNIEIHEFRVRGRIDQIRREPDPDGVEIKSMVDIKTGRNPFTQMEAFLQSYLYWEAIQQMDEKYRTDSISFYFARHHQWFQGRIRPNDHRRLAYQILKTQSEKIANKQFAPEFTPGCKMCSYSDMCEGEISLWQPGSDLKVYLEP